MNLNKTVPSHINDFIKVQSKCGLKLKTTYFPAVDKPHSTLFFIHSYGSYLTKYAPVMQFYQSAGYEVIGFDMRGFGESEGPRALITNPQDMLDDSVRFIDAAKNWQMQERGHNLPWVAMGYSLGGCYLLGAYQELHKHP